LSRFIDEPDSSKTVFWTKHWEAGMIPWDFGGVPPASLAFLKRNVAPLLARVLFPCCGTGYEAHAFYEVGQRASRNPGLSLFSRRIGHTL
jgi:hypothetical protein